MNLITNVENRVCSIETMSRHPDLYHYTSAFEAIVRSQALWCSHFRDMADTDEVLLMRERLPTALAPRMDAIANTLNRNKRRAWNTCGRGVAMAPLLVDALYGATFTGKALYSALEAYLFSFSTHADDTEFDRKHGVRSQWDGYAGPEGSCLVFDSAELARMLKEEGEARYWAWLMLEPIRYSDRAVEDIFPELVTASADTLRQFIDGVRSPEVPSVEFLRGATLLKAPKYKPEREVRIVAIPGTAKLAAHAAREYPNEFDAAVPLPETKSRTDGRRYIALFDGSGMPLPIKRVIIGPGCGQEERAERAQALLGAGVPITLSCCP